MAERPIDVDCSYVGFKVGKKAQSVANFLITWSTYGLQMNPVCDGKRPISKQATNKRKADREKHRIEAHCLRHGIVSSNHQLKSNTLTDSERNDIREEIAKMQRSMKSKETQSRNVMEPNFEEKLIEELETTGAHTRNNANGSVSRVMKAEFQADAVIMGRVANRKTLMAITGDADQPLLGGDDFVAVKEFTKDGCMEVVSTSRETIEKLQRYLTEEQSDYEEDDKSHPVFKPAAYPLFENVTDRKLRAVMALILGCDVYGKGLEGVGAKTLSDMINIEYPKFNETAKREYTLLAYLKWRMWTGTEGFDIEVVNTYIRALLYEPTNLAPEGDDEVQRTYLGNEPPARLPADYLEEFALDGFTNIVNRVKVEVCKGVGACSHMFLAADGVYKCASCEELVCTHCKGEIDGETNCLPCYAANRLIPESDVEGGMTISEMRTELSSRHDVEHVNELTIDEVQEMYAIREIASSRIKGQLNSVPLPLHPTCEMDAESTENWDTIVEDVNLRDGGAFLSDPDLDKQYLPGILSFFAALVTFDSEEHTDWKSKAAVYKAVPSMFVDLAKRSRLDDGYRLLKRCIRHAFDSRCKSIDDVVGSLVMDKDGNIGIRLGTDVPASMRKDIYQTEIVATAMDILGCKCSCKCGSQGNERIVCVHTIVVLYLLSVLLIEDLAESMLIALASRINGSIDSSEVEGEDQQWMWNMSNWNEAETVSMKQSIITLMEAAGEYVPDANTKTIPELLQAFVVGTESRKKWKEKSKVPPKPSELGPIKDMEFMSTAKRAKLTVRPNLKAPPFDICMPVNEHTCSLPNCSINEDSPHQDMKECNGDNCNKLVHPSCHIQYEESGGFVHEENRWFCQDCHPKTPPPPKYLRILSLMKVAGCEVDDSKIVGLRLLAMRGVKELGTDFSKQRLAEKKAVEEWTKLEKKTHQRSRNITTSQSSNLNKRNQRDTLPTAKTPNSKKRKHDAVVTPSPQPTTKRLRRRGCSLPIKSAPKPKNKTPPKKRSKFIKCHMWGSLQHPHGRCSVNSHNSPNMKFPRVPKHPSELRSDNPERQSVINRAGKVFLRREILRRMGYSPDYEGERRICMNHDFEEITKCIPVTFKDEQFSQSYRLRVPHAGGNRSSELTSTTSKGNGAARLTTRLVTDVVETAKQLPPGFSVEALKEEHEGAAEPTSLNEKLRHTEEELLLREAELEQSQAAHASEVLANCQSWEQNSDESHISINPTVARAAGLDVHIPTPFPESNDPRFFKQLPLPRQGDTTRTEHSKLQPTITLDISDDEVQRRTGFPTKQHLLSYIFIVCDGDINLITRRQTVLTWLEAWFMHFEFKWGRTIPRLQDAAALYGGIDKKYIKHEIRLKYSIERNARTRWPTYASYEEDISLRDEEWDKKYDGLRIIFHDMTNIPAYGFSDADLSRITYSKYYAMNCFKGGIYCQLCGWIGTADLWTGAVSDTDYNKRAGYLEQQQQYQNEDLVNGKIIPWTNVYDKGYRAKLVAWRAGEQKVLQPVWAESDRRFGRDDTLLTAAVAHDRGANERAVNVCKRSWLVSRGFQPNGSANELNDAWMTWSFQVNFMFNPVL